VPGPVSGLHLPQTRQAPRAPSHETRRYLPPSECRALHQQALPYLPRYYELMRQSYPLPAPRYDPCARRLCRLLPAPAGGRTFPTLSLRIFPRVPGPIPRRPPRCIHSFLPSGHRPSPSLQRVGAPQIPGQPLPSRGFFRGCSQFVLFRPASLLATQVAPTAASSRTRGGRGFYIRAPRGSLPPHGPDMLGVRIEQLTPGRLPLPKIRSLVGCSACRQP
jgi:hypothetical protein